MKKIVILGSTGSVGLSTLDVVRQFPKEFQVVGLAARSRVDLLKEQIAEFNPQVACLTDAAAASQLRGAIPKNVHLVKGEDGLLQVAQWPDAGLVMAATSGSSALVPVLKAMESGKDVALANKEIMVISGALLSQTAAKHHVRIIPVDSEHNAIFQCIEGAHTRDVHRIILTGSGGPLKDMPQARFETLTPEEVIRHPKWKMGKKISVDSATMMNKGLEAIEAEWFFGVTSDQIKIVIHPEAIVHSMAEFVDGSILAQMGPTDMRLPILFALGYPKRLKTTNIRLRLEDIRELHFEAPDFGKFPCLQMALEVAREKASTKAACLNSANELAVHAFLEGRIGFTDIPKIIEDALSHHDAIVHPRLDDILRTEAMTREYIEEGFLCKK